MTIIMKAGGLSLAQAREIFAGQPVTLDEGCRARVEAAAGVVERIVADGKTVYGVNTGFGRLATTSIPADKVLELQHNLVLSHSAGTGPLIDDATVRLILALKANSLARGHSGVRWTVIDALMRLIAAEVYPCIPSKGSVGASGDLAPLAHASGVLIGVGDVRHCGEVIPATVGLERAGLAPLELGPKEGLALLNGTQVSTALALRGLFAAEDAFAAATVAGAMSVEAGRGTDVPFDPRIHEVRGQPGQADMAKAYRALLEGSAIRASHVDCGRVQDPYSLRCQPQVMGACLDHLRFASEVLAREANAVSDNPLVFVDEGEVLSGGNFHAQPVAMASDVLALSIAEIGALSERRIALLMDEALSGLPPFLAAPGGMHSGFMIAQVTAAALASENKSLAHPASVDSMPTSANQEDHVSMATFAARRLADMACNTAEVVAIELIIAAQGIDILEPLETSDRLAAVHAELRARVPSYQVDRRLSPDIAAAAEWVQGGAFRAVAGVPLPSSP